MSARYHSLREALRDYHAGETTRAVSATQKLVEGVSYARLKTQAHIKESTRLIRKTRELLLQIREAHEANID
jgi:hypothetical protein